MLAPVHDATTGPERCVTCDAALAGPYRYGLLRQFAAKREHLTSDAAREHFHDRLAEFAEPVSFANVVLLAAALSLCFRYRRRRFLEHAAFSMHAVSFMLLSSITLMFALRFRFWLGV